ncbi:hypothetical protein [Humibacter ginsenosidimutans]|uniref:DUF4878 domain-containing protein n=1 Tax=Humibacter ginsenosidimutans TaxID=2599293 RepID=A0A5B8M275_9MICO|nr:hypothetical protein [Humibacter ginsenosidimutans]QDZ13965.1 hypothetical protein FPZ11_03460 [Humibacter ginsenosidimutans]
MLLFALLGGNGAKAAAESYLSALAKGDATSANRLAHVNTAEHDNAMLTNSVLSSAKAKITDAKVTRTASSRSSDLTYVYVTYSLGGTSYHDTMQLQKDAKGWYVREGLTYRLPMLDGSSSSSNAGYSVKGSSTAVTVDDYGMVAYPGLYEATSPNQFYTLSESVTVTAAPDAATTIKGVSLTPSQKYVDAVQKQVDAHYDKCATLTDYYQIEDCGIELGFPDNVMITGSKVAVKIGTHPKVSVDDSDSYNQFKLDDGSFSATITGETYDGGTGSEQIEAGAGYASADITIKDGKVVVTFD